MASPSNERFLSVFLWKCQSNSGQYTLQTQSIASLVANMSQENPDVFSKDTFLTSLRNGSGTEDAVQSTTKSSVDEPQGFALPSGDSVLHHH